MPVPKPFRGARNAARRLHDTLAGVEALKADVARLSADVHRLAEESRAREDHHTAQVDALAAGLTAWLTDLGELIKDPAPAAAMLERHRETVELLRLVHDAEPANRQRLWQIRETPEYARAYEEPEPLVTVGIGTYRNTEGLMERALPSVLSQTYENIEVVIVGDAAPPETERALKALDDPRVRYRNLPLRGPYPDDPEARWCVAGGPPANEAMRMARGRWIAAMDDDDVCTPDRIEVLLRAARERDLEFCYGRIRRHDPDGTTMLLSEFPPTRQGHVGLTASLSHADMRFIASELGDSQFHVPGDWSRVRRMIRIGVRVGMIDDVVLDYYPSKLWKPPAVTEVEGGSAA